MERAPSSVACARPIKPPPSSFLKAAEPPRRHYSSRQQVAPAEQPLHLSSSSPASSPSGSGAMLAYNQHAHQRHLQHQQHPAMTQHQTNTNNNKQRQMAAVAAQRQQQAAKLAAGYAMASTGGSKGGAPSSSSTSHQSAGTDLTSGSTSSAEHTLDDLHALHAGATSASYSAATSAGKLHQRRLSRPPTGGGGRFLLGVLFTLAQLLLFGSLAGWLYWAYLHDDGLAWQPERKQQFNAHAALMLLGLVFLNGQAMLIYRAFQCCAKIYAKLVHAVLFVLATSAISLGLVLAWSAQDNVGPSQRPATHLYSLHAWLGLATVGLFVLQFLFGFVSFLILLCCDSATARFRHALLPIHKTFGLVIFNLAIATCLTGLLQTARSRLSAKLNKTDYHELGEAGLLINLIGMALVALAILMPYIIRNLQLAGTASALLPSVSPTAGQLRHHQRHFRSDLVDRHLKLAQLDMRI